MAGVLFPEIETPVLLVERRILQANIARMQKVANDAGVVLRPHIKTHKCVEVAQRQIGAGAAGVTVATLTEAEVMVDAGSNDVFIAYPPIGDARLDRLGQLLDRATIRVGVADGDGVAALAGLGARLGRDVHYLWEVDSGLGRLGTPPGEPTAKEILAVLDQPGTVFDGLFTHAGHAYRATGKEIHSIGIAEGQCLVETAELLRNRDVDVPVVSTGSTPTAVHSGSVAGVTEIRPGNYVFNDASQVSLGVANLADCALTVLATVVGRPAPDRVVIDAGSKALSPENPSGRCEGWGIVLGDENFSIERLFEEHGVMRLVDGSSHLRLDDRVRIVPNHACTTTNLHERLWLVDGDDIDGALPVRARGWARIGGRT